MKGNPLRKRNAQLLLLALGGCCFNGSGEAGTTASSSTGSGTTGTTSGSSGTSSMPVSAGTATAELEVPKSMAQ